LGGGGRKIPGQPGLTGEILTQKNKTKKPTNKQTNKKLNRAKAIEQKADIMF
jgi:hypothetical protein